MKDSAHYTQYPRKKQPPYAAQWQRWADTLYAYLLVDTAGNLKTPHSKLVGSIYVLSDDRIAWDACKDGYRDYNPRSAGGRDWHVEEWTGAENELDFRLYHETCRTLLPAKTPPESLDWRVLARPFLWLRVVYDAGSKQRAEALGTALIDSAFLYIHGVEI